MGSEMCIRDSLHTLLKKIDLNQSRDSHQEETSLFMMEALSGVETLSLPITSVSYTHLTLPTKA